MGRLALKLLGPPEVGHDGRPVKFHARKALALLAYLAAEGVRSRGEITALLWPASDERRGRTALRSALSSLRGTLEEASEAPGKAHVLTEGDTLALAFDSKLELDLHALEAAYALARSNPRTEDLDHDARLGMLARLRAGAEAYRGDFLEGFSLNDAPDFDFWVDAERETLRGRMNLVHDRFSRVQLESGEVGDAIATAVRWTEHAPLNEEAHRRLMEAQFAAGDRSGALDTYKTFSSLSSRELGTEPGPETKALAAYARGGASGHGAPQPIAPSVPRPETRRTLLSDMPFVGRSEEFGALVEGYQAALSGEARAVVLLGDAGIGKTRLAEEFLLWAREEGADVLEGRMYEAGRRLPYGILTNAIRPRIESERAPDDLLEDVWLSELSRLLPELKDRYPDLPPPTGDEAEARTRLFEAVTRLVMALGERSPVVLFLDDLHWASRVALDVVQYAGQRWAEENARVLLVLNLRAEATETLPAPSGWVSDLARVLPVRRLTLDPLSSGETLDLVWTLAGDTPEHGEQISAELEHFGRWLFEETDGHPLFLTETIKVLLERGVLAARLGTDGAWVVSLTPEAREVGALRGLLPESVREAISAQLSRLGSAASELLAAGAVLGHGFTFEQLMRVADLSEGECLSALDEVLAGHLLKEADPSNHDGYAFLHDKVRDVAYTEAGAARRRVFHRRALAALQEESISAAQLARHALAAGMQGAAFHYLLAAGDAAMAVFAAEDAIGHYEQARSLLGDESGRQRGSRDSPSAELEHLHVNLGRARELAGEWEEAQNIYEEMLSRGREARDSRLEWVALNRLAILVAQRYSDMGRAAALVRESLEAAEGSGDRAMLAESEWNLAQMAALGWEPETALSHGERALDLARELDLEELEARSLYVLGLAHNFAGGWEECADHASRAAALYEALGDEPVEAGTLAAQYVWAGAPPSKELANRAMEAMCLGVLAAAEVNRGSPGAAVEAGRHALRIAREIDNDWAQSSAMATLDYGLVETGEYEEALRVARRHLETARKVRYPMAINALIILGNTLQAMLGLEEARAALLEALAAADAILMGRWKITILSKLCTNRALAGDREAAHHYASEAVALREAAPTRLISFDFEHHHETEALLRGGEERLAREDARRLGESVGQNRRFRLVHLRMLAVLNRWDDAPEGAIGHLREAEALAEVIGLPGELWQIRAALGELHEERGESEEARGSFARATAIVRELADKMEDAELRSGFLGAPQVRRVLDRRTRLLAPATPGDEPARRLPTEQTGRRNQKAKPQTEEIEHLYVNSGRAYELAGEWEQAQSAYEEMLSRGRETRDPRLEWAALNRLAILAAQRYSDRGKAAALVQESLEVAEGSGDRTMVAETEWNLAQMDAIRWKPQDALSHGERALDLASELGLEELEARSLYVLGLAYSMASRWDECVAHASRAAALYEALGDEPVEAGTLAAQYVWAGAPPSKELANRAMEVMCLSLLAAGEVNRGSPREGVEAGRRALRIGREIGNDWAQGDAMVTLNPGLVETGEYEEALRVARWGLEAARKLRYPMAICMELTALGRTLQAMLSLEEARTAYLEALAVTDTIPLPPWKILIISGLCANRALAGDWEAAHRYASEAVEIRDAAPRRLMVFDFYRHHETEALLNGGEERLARDDARRLGERVGNNRRFRLVHLRMLAVLDKWDSNARGTFEHLREAESLAEEIGLPGELWQVRAALGEIHEALGENEEARVAFHRAARVIEALAEKIGDEELREGFLSAPQVRRLLVR